MNADVAEDVFPDVETMTGVPTTPAHAGAIGMVESSDRSGRTDRASGGPRLTFLPSRRSRRTTDDTHTNEARPVDTEFDVASAYDAHGASLLGYAVTILRDRVAAEDCVQETFLRAWRARDRFDPSRGGARTWLFAIARNVITDAVRSRARTPPIASTPVEDVDGVTADRSTEIDDRLRVVEGLAVLSAEHRQVVVAIHLTGMSYRDLAAQTGIPVATLRTRAFYALRALRTHFDGQEES